MMLISLLVSVAGSRLFYVAFSWGFYKENLNAILDFRNGGYALYGGLLFGFLAAAVFCRITKTSFWQSADIACPGILLGQAIGRWGNFFEQRIFRRIYRSAMGNADTGFSCAVRRSFGSNER